MGSNPIIFLSSFLDDEVEKAVYIQSKRGRKKGRGFAIHDKRWPLEFVTWEK
jgi:hypothetical protein